MTTKMEEWVDLVLPRRFRRSRYVNIDRSASTDHSINCLKGVAGLTARDIKLIIEGGYHTVEAVAYTFAFSISTYKTSF